MASTGHSSSSATAKAFSLASQCFLPVQEARLIQYDKLTSDDTVSATAHDFPAAFENILHVLPRTMLIAVVNGASPNERFWLGELQRETAFLAGRVELKFYNEMSLGQIIADAAKFPLIVLFSGT